MWPLRAFFILLLFIANVAAAPSGDISDSALINMYEPSDSYHSDFRDTPKLLFHVDFRSPGNKGAEVAQKYLESKRELFKIHLADLSLSSIKPSLLSHHYMFQQQIGNYQVSGASITVSVKENTVLQVYNNTFPLTRVQRKEALESKNYIGKERAYDIAWKILRVHGPLLEKSSAKMIFLPEKNGFRMVYRVRIAVAEPFGYWQFMIDAVTAKIIERTDRRIVRKPLQRVKIQLYTGKIWSRKKAFARFETLQKSARAAQKKLSSAKGSGKVFDPDPRTTLNDDSLKDKTSASAFDAAYFVRDLLDISFDGSRYSLTGPWVKIADFESPATVPSQSANGHWTDLRGSNGFNDVMTYYHLDKNQRYMQSLGFTGERGIQQVQINVDSDGLGGADNSHYIPGSNRVAFGHGCVDDNEDADVILHEYGHAIHYSINSNWTGGDTGAMGEGFGDYWAGSYSLSQSGGAEFKPNQVFDWDGHGPSNACWPGRMMNRMQARYDHAKNYSAHSGIGGGIQSDELWSTPLFQALLSLINKGYQRKDVDRIVLEAHFGLGSGIKMREMANAIINTARRLYPNDAYAAVFTEKFNHHNIIELPKAAFKMSDLVLSGVGSNGKPDPGETFRLSVSLKNTGNHGSINGSAMLTTSSQNVQINHGESAIPDMDIGQTGELATPFEISVNEDFQCGDKVKLKMVLGFDGGASSEQVMAIKLGTGVAQGIDKEKNHGSGLMIPDNNSEGVTSTISSNSSERVMPGGIKIHINLIHTYIGDLKIELSSPGGKKAVLHNRSGSSRDNIVGTYPVTLAPAESLNIFNGELIAGDWTLKLTDGAGQDVGALMSWGIEAVSSYICQ